ncbi:alkaline phosphatase PhoX [Sphingorhabdus sp. Alg239-R122]|uniref:alkaline phosphatase PhoX n=1 Tax=Sphingorhabdus sp. Alg239-R122 TaxID=2305989 RepID=UPI0013DA004E|nr:alkaline phosphatase PhoX [Sphingorhabdus sp. Alg239-R122]
MTLSRRSFMKKAQAAGIFYASLSLSGSALAFEKTGKHPLVPDPDGILDLPEGFTYRLISKAGDMMSDGFFRPGRADGMACFPHPDDDGKCILMRNHENWPSTESGSPFGDNDELLDRLPEGKLYDTKATGRPFFGGVTKLVYDLEKKEMVEDFLVLAGTAGNCAGGPTPWGSWLSCEEAAVVPAEGANKHHGFVFEVPASATGPVDPKPITAMGRFVHEAAAVDPQTGIVYMTEDNPRGLFYRYIPDVPEQLHKGGKLQALVIKGRPSAVTSNWPRDWGGEGQGPTTYMANEIFAVTWIDMEDATNYELPGNELAKRGHAAGAAQFFRGEGMDYALRSDGKTGDIYFSCTQGGIMGTGQIWRYTPSATSDGVLELVYESPGADTMDMCDNIAVAPWGDLVLCEDGRGDQYLRGLTSEGQIYEIARNAHSEKSEFCGACFSPDGQVMFVNIQEPGLTLAIEGPWKALKS